MVTKFSAHGREYEINGRTIVWHPEGEADDGTPLADVKVPLRIKMKVVLRFAEDELDNGSMVAMLKAIIPESQHAALEEMDVNDFQDMFTTWQSEYNSLTGGSLGESSPSPSSSDPTEAASSTTGDPVSV